MAIEKDRLNKLIEQGADYQEILQESRRVDMQILESMQGSKCIRKDTNEQYIDRFISLKRL